MATLSSRIYPTSGGCSWSSPVLLVAARPRIVAVVSGLAMRPRSGLALTRRTRLRSSEVRRTSPSLEGCDCYRCELRKHTSSGGLVTGVAASRLSRAPRRAHVGHAHGSAGPPIGSSAAPRVSGRRITQPAVIGTRGDRPAGSPGVVNGRTRAEPTDPRRYWLRRPDVP